MLEPIALRDMRKQVDVMTRAERIFDAALLFGLYELGVFTALRSGPKALDELSEVIEGSEEALGSTLDAAVALDLLLKHRDGTYEAGEDLLDCLGRHDAPAFLGEWMEFFQSLATPLLQLPTAVRQGGAYFDDLGIDDQAARTMTRAMDNYARSRGVELARHVDFSRTATMLDAGCGPGTYSLAVAERHPGLHVTLLDLPGPIEEARVLAAARGLEARCEFVACDAFDYFPTTPFDVVLISNTLHMLGASASQELLKHLFSMVAPGGRIIVQAMYLNDDRTSPRWPALLDLVMKVITPTGRNHTVQETMGWLTAAGFIDLDYVPMSLWNVCSCVVGYRAGPR